jgi:hypothetical protein
MEGGEIMDFPMLLWELAWITANTVISIIAIYGAFYFSWLGVIDDDKETPSLFTILCLLLAMATIPTTMFAWMGDLGWWR